MLQPRLVQIHRVLPILEARQIKSILRIACGDKENVITVDLQRQLTLYLYEWLVHLGIFESGQIERLLVRMRFQIEITARHYEANDDNAEHAPWQRDDARRVLSIADKRWAVWWSDDVVRHPRYWYDMETDSELPKLLKPCVTFLVCNLAALLEQKQEWLRRLEGVDHAGHPDNPGRQGAPAETKPARSSDKMPDG